MKSEKLLYKLSSSSNKRINGFLLLGLAVLSSVLGILSFPREGLYLLAYIAYIPLFFIFWISNPKQSFFYGFISGFLFFLGLTYWVIDAVHLFGGVPKIIAVLAWLLLSAYAGLSYGFFTFTLSMSRPFLLIAAPVCWTAIEYLRGVLFTGFPFGIAGYSQYKFLNLIQISDITGVYGVSFFIILINTLLFLIIIKFRETKSSDSYKQITSYITAVLLLFLMFSEYGKARLAGLKFSDDKVRVGIIQGNIDQNLKWDKKHKLFTIEKYEKLSKMAKDAGASIVIWPETAMPFIYDAEEAYRKRLSDFAALEKLDIIFGVPSAEFITEDDYLLYNSAYLINENGMLGGRYDKVHLVPFGEYIPLKNILFFIGKLVEAMGDFIPGKDFPLLKADKGRFGVLICYEAIFPELVREYARGGANVITAITNDAWFGVSSAPYQLFAMSVFRAVENRLPLVRSANSGISGFVSAEGKIKATSSIFKEEIIIDDVILANGEMTIYAVLGDIFAITCVIISSGFLLIGLLNYKKNFVLSSNCRIKWV